MSEPPIADQPVTDQPVPDQPVTRCLDWVDASAAGGDKASAAENLRSAMDDLACATHLVESAELPLERQPERQQVLDFCREHPDALHRSCLSGHLTGSAFVVDSTEQSVLLIHHRKLSRWLQPGGHADGQGNLALVALSEVREETGLGSLTLLLPAFDLDVHVIPARPGEPEHLHLDLRFVVLAGAEQDLEPAEGEVFDAKWFESNDPDLVSNPDVNLVAARALRIVSELKRV